MSTIHHLLRVVPSLTVGVLMVVRPPVLEAQDQSIVEAVVEVLEWLDDDYTLVPEFGQWGMAFGWFSEGEEKEMEFTVSAGDRYLIAGGGDADADDIDICVYDDYGFEVECDVGTDSFPVVSFRASSSGTYRAVLTAYSLNGRTAYAGMALLKAN